MSETNKKTKSNWFDAIADGLLGQIGPGTSTPAGVETHGPGGGFSIATERYPGAEPPDDAITVITRIR